MNYDYEWVLDLFAEGDLLHKHMFGGRAFYYDGKMVLVIMASPGERSYKNKTFPFDIWNGLLFPTEREVHGTIMSRYPMLVEHPVLPKWLYMPFDTEDFDELAVQILKEIRLPRPEWGIWPKPKKRKSKDKIKSRKKATTKRKK